MRLFVVVVVVVVVAVVVVVVCPRKKDLTFRATLLRRQFA